jgi:HK97 family phage major capsid protein
VVEYLADGLGDRLYIPAITQNPSATLTYGTATALGTATASDPTITAGAVQTDRVQALSLADNTILADAPPRYFNDLGNALVTSVSEKIDAVIFAGGSYTTAIGSVSGIGTVSMGANGATIASTGVDPFITAYGTAVQAGARPSVWVMNAAAYTSLLKVKSLVSGSNTPLLFSNALSSVAGAVPYTLMGLPILVTSGTATIGNGETAGTATNTTSAYLLDSSKISLLYRTESTGGEPITLTADRSRYFVENQTAILATARVGLRVTQPAAVTRITGIIA